MTTLEKMKLGSFQIPFTSSCWATMTLFYIKYVIPRLALPCHPALWSAAVATPCPPGSACACLSGTGEQENAAFQLSETNA